MRATVARDRATPFGRLLQQWRRVRGKTQLDLALEAEVSPRHLSFVETGRSTPSREMVLLLASALEVPLRERNILLGAAGYAAVYSETRLEAPELEPARLALELILAHQEPYPAVVMNRHWDLVSSNVAARIFFSFLLGELGEAAPAPNVVRLMFHPDGLRPYVTNWEVVASSLIQRVHREAVGGLADEATRRLLDEVLGYPGVPKPWRLHDPTAPVAPFVPIAFRKDDVSMRWFSAVTTLGTPQDVTLQELRVECFFPADRDTAEQARRLLRAGPAEATHAVNGAAAG